MRQNEKQDAIVVGGSIAGLLTARILSKHFQRVTIIEKDKLREENEPRKSVPQGHQLHTVLSGGLRILERFFPGLIDELAARGAVISDDITLEQRWFTNGRYCPHVATGLKSVMLTRPFLEETMCRRVRAIPNVKLTDGSKVSALCSDGKYKRITGVRLAGQPGQELEADLVVDATGRGSKSPKWLNELGYTPPQAEEIEIKVHYASRLYPCPTGFRSLIMTGSHPPYQARQGSLQPVEGDRIIVSLSGRGDDRPSRDEAEFNAHAQSLLTQDISAVMADLEPLSDIRVYNVPKTCWYHYEKLTRFPACYLVLGDAVCALNPIYGQGITTAARQVEVLDKLLDKRSLSKAFWKVYFKEIAKIVGPPWQLTARGDFSFPQTEGKLPQMLGFIAAYMGKLTEAMTHDPEVLKAFFKVMHMTKAPTALFHPRIAWRVLRGRGRKKS